MSIMFRVPLGPFLRRPATSPGKRVLLVRDDVIGDLLVPTSAVVRWLLQQEYDVYLVLRKELAEIGLLLLPQERLLALDMREYRTSLGYRYRFLQNIRAIGFDYALGSTIHSSVNEDIVRTSGASECWGYQRHGTLKERFRLRGISKVASLPVLDGERLKYTSVVEHERHFLEAAFGVNIPSGPFGPALRSQFEMRKEEVFLDANSGIQGEKWRDGEKNLVREDLPERYIHYLAEAGAVKRVFPPDRMLPILLDVGNGIGMKVVLTGLKRQNIDDERCINLTGQTTLPEVLDIVKRASVVVGNESGLTHLAWVLGKKTALFYGGGHWGRFRPEGDILLLNVPCEYRCCDWKCRYDSIPVPCVNLDDGELRVLLQKFMVGTQSS